MPLHSTFSHPHRLAIVIAKGSIAAAEFVELIGKIDDERAQAYRKIFDVTDLETVFADDLIQRLADIVRARAGATGPIAIVAREGHARRQAQLFAGAVANARLIAVFYEHHVARKWLDELPATGVGPPSTR